MNGMDLETALLSGMSFAKVCEMAARGLVTPPSLPSQRSNPDTATVKPGK
jgi:hypothetical protein